MSGLRRKRFIRLGRAAGHDALFIGNVALPRYATIIGLVLVGIFLFAMAGQFLGAWVWVFLGYLALVPLLLALYWLYRGVEWIVSVTRAMNGGRVER